MTRSLRRWLTLANRSFDVVCGLLLLLAAFALVNAQHMPSGIDDFFSARLTVKNVLLLSAFLAFWYFAFAFQGLHRPASRHDLLAQSKSILRAATVGSIPLFAFPLTSRTGLFTVGTVIVFWLMAVAVETIGRTLISLVARSWMRQGTVKVVIVGSGPRARRLLRRIKAKGLTHYDVLGFFDHDAGHAIPEEIQAAMLGRADRLQDFLKEHAVDRVFITLPVRSCYSVIENVLTTCERMGVEVHYLADLFPVTRARVSHDASVGLSAIRLTHVIEDSRLAVKRVLDVAGAASGLLVLSPLLVLCAVLIRLSGPGPVLFTQTRYGYNRRRFRMYKFRTMVADAEKLQASLESRNEAAGPIFKIRHDPRITPLGRFLRKTSIDELPQLFNVLTGEMSLVGPRPMSVRDVSLFTEAALMRRFSMKPGLTCLWQISGRSNTTFDRWIELDLAYIDNWSLTLDARILLKTVPVVMSGSGAM
jgi:exopolysaccharide biosynthesis polyprenyl glycosylphosphotransferase